jgi:16S rRNA processing protein RimM
MNNTENRFVEIARIGKVHGLDGTVRLRLAEDAEPIIKKDSLFYLKNRRGDLIPSRIVEFRVEKKHNVHLFFVKFDRIANRSEAGQFQDTPVYADVRIQQEPSETVHESIKGFEITDESGIIGRVAGVMQNPAHPIIEMETVDRNSETDIILIPWVEEYVISIDRNLKQVHCQNLDQLINL